MGRLLLAIVTVASMSMAGCERTQVIPMTSPDALPLRLAQPEPGFRLTPADRRRIVEGFDVAALERLLSRVRPDMRETILAYFRVPAPGERAGQLLQIYDPELQTILEEVWAPMWDSASDDVFEKRLYDIPGWEIARKRREERKREQGQQNSPPSE